MHNAIELSPRFAAFAPLSIASAACSTGDAASTWAGTVVDSAGVEIVHNRIEGIWESGESWTLEEVLSIGETIGEEAYQFGQIVSVETDAAGNVYVADFQAQEVRVFDTEGVYTHTIGSPGAGPGEIGAGLSGVFALSDEVVVPVLAPSFDSERDHHGKNDHQRLKGELGDTSE